MRNTQKVTVMFEDSCYDEIGDIEFFYGAAYIYSMWEGYREKDSWNKTKELIETKNMN